MSESDSSNEEVILDELENESLDLEPRKKKMQSSGQKKGKSALRGADLGEEDDEDADTIFIDNLPNNDIEIRQMLIKVD